LDSRKPAKLADSRRASERVEYEPAVPPLVELLGAGAPTGVGGGAGGGGGFVVVARNLSSGGIAFLHGAEVPSGTRCIITLFDSHAAAAAIPAEVIRC